MGIHLGYCRANDSLMCSSARDSCRNIMSWIKKKERNLYKIVAENQTMAFSNHIKTRLSIIYASCT